jgi:MazG family protein
MLEEAYEAVEAMSLGTAGASLQEELGDVLLQVVLNAQLAQDTESFTIENVIDSINAKMRRRHPHVFKPTGHKVTEESIRQSWESIKLEEKASQGNSSTKLASQLATIAKSFPATIQAQKIGRLTEKLNFDWSDPREVLDQVQSELDEVREAMLPANKENPEYIAAVAEEIGDVYFSLAQLCRHLGLDSEVVALNANAKFNRRLTKLETLALAQGIPIDQATPEVREEWWAQVKRQEKSSLKTER